MIRRILALVLSCLSLAVPAFPKDKYQAVGPVHLDKEGEKWAEKTLRSMTLEQKIGQMVMIWARAEFVNVPSFSAKPAPGRR